MRSLLGALLRVALWLMVTAAVGFGLVLLVGQLGRLEFWHAALIFLVSAITAWFAVQIASRRWASFPPPKVPGR